MHTPSSTAAGLPAHVFGQLYELFLSQAMDVSYETALACLMEIGMYFLQGMLGDQALGLLRDEEFRILEVSFSQVSSDMLRETLAVMPCIRHLCIMG